MHRMNIQRLPSVVLRTKCIGCNKKERVDEWFCRNHVRKSSTLSSWLGTKYINCAILNLPVLPSTLYRSQNKWNKQHESDTAFQVRHPSCVDRITSIDKMQSNTTIIYNYIIVVFDCILSILVVIQPIQNKGYALYFDKFYLFPELWCELMTEN